MGRSENPIRHALGKVYVLNSLKYNAPSTLLQQILVVRQDTFYLLFQLHPIKFVRSLIDRFKYAGALPRNPSFIVGEIDVLNNALLRDPIFTINKNEESKFNDFSLEQYIADIRKKFHEINDLRTIKQTQKITDAYKDSFRTETFINKTLTDLVRNKYIIVALTSIKL